MVSPAKNTLPDVIPFSAARRMCGSVNNGYLQRMTNGIRAGSDCHARGRKVLSVGAIPSEKYTQLRGETSDRMLSSVRTFIHSTALFTPL